jgi:hypothetical protein
MSDITIRRVSNDPFCRIPNETLHDSRISFKAKGLLAYLLSKPDNWIPRLAELLKNSKEGESSITAGLNELREFNYAELQRCVKQGKTVQWRLIISDVPLFQSRGEPVVVNTEEEPDGESPELGNPHLENRGLNKKERGKENTETNKKEEEALVAYWNKQALLPSIKILSKGRASHLRQRLSEKFFRENWRQAIDKVSKSRFCTGVNPRKWRADIDFFLRPDTIGKIMEGKYDDKDAKATFSGSSGWGKVRL